MTVTQHRMSAKPEQAFLRSALCPDIAHMGVRARQVPGGEVAARPMNLVATDKTGTRATTITAVKVLVHLRAAAIQYGEARMGFSASRIGTHSPRAGAALAMFLAGVPLETIQIIGRWRSQTFMRYIFTIKGEETRTDLRKKP